MWLHAPMFQSTEGVVVQSFSHVRFFETPWTAARQASPGFTIFRSLLKLTSTESGMPSNHLILCCPLLLLPSIFPSIRVFSNELVLCIRWPNYWASAAASVFPMTIQGWFPLGLTGLISWWGSKIYILWVISLMARIWPSTLILYPSCWLEFKC